VQTTSFTGGFDFIFANPLAFRQGICYNYVVYSKYRGDENYLCRKVVCRKPGGWKPAAADEVSTFRTVQGRAL